MDKYINILKMLSDKTRTRILRTLLKANRELCICEIMDSLKLPHHNVSRHIGGLRLTGLVKERPEGRFVFYSVIPPKDRFSRNLLAAVISIPEDNFVKDIKRLKKRLSLRKKGKCVVGMKCKAR